MSQPLRELRNLLVASQTARGRVIEVTNGLLRVATAGGVVEVASNTDVQVGDQVMIRNGRAVKSQGTAYAPVFQV